MSWQCPECGETDNDDSLIRCVCGYMDGEEDVVKAYADYFAKETTKKAEIAAEKKRKANRKTDYTFLWKWIRNLFNWRTWKHAYVRWVVCFFIGLRFYRHTIDGTIFLFIFSVLVALRLQHCRKTGEGFVPNRKKGERLWDYGLKI